MIRPSERRYLLLGLMVLVTIATARSQTTCSLEHPGAGLFICDPSPQQNSASTLPRLFHFSAQVNADEGHRVFQYLIRIDDRVVYDVKVAVPTQTLSIETNVLSPFISGRHTLTLAVPGVGNSVITDLAFKPAAYESICDPFRRYDSRVCPISAMTETLAWTPTAKAAGSFAGFADYLHLFGQNLKSIEADIADALFLSREGKVVMATHSSTNVELRRYEPNGSITYDAVVNACGPGFLEITGVAVDNVGRAWIAGNTSACIPTTTAAAAPPSATALRGFVMVLDTRKIGSNQPIYSAYVSDVPSRVNAIRLDAHGNSYIAGTTGSLEFPHDHVVNVPGIAGSEKKSYGFVVAFNSSGSRSWSSLLPGASLTALVLKSPAEVFVTGHANFSAARDQNRTCDGHNCDDVLVAALAEGGSRLSYLASLGGSASEEGRAISQSSTGDWLYIAGATNSPDFPAERTPASATHFVTALRTCSSTEIYSHRFESPENILPEPAIPVVLDRFAAAVTLNPGGGTPGKVKVMIAPPCSER